VPATAAGALVAELRGRQVPAEVIGRTGGNSLTLPGETPISLTRLNEAHEGWLPRYMAS